MMRLILICYCIFTCIHYSVAEIHFSVSTNSIEDNRAKIVVPFSYQDSNFAIPDASLSIRLDIHTANEREPINSLTSTQFVSTTNSAYGSLSLIINQPNIWSPEIPNLYTATLTVLSNDNAIGQQSAPFGIRIVSVEKNSVKMNNLPLRIKGINYKFTNNHWYDDLLLMKELHINAIRLNDAYPSRDFLEQCNVMGLYVVCSPPTAIQTKSKVPSHPCIIAWELPPAEATETRIHSLRFLDPSRLIISSKENNPFNLLQLNTPHSLHPNQWLQQHNHPLLLLECPSIDNHKMEGLEELQVVMHSTDNVLGAFIHQFSDLIEADRSLKPSAIQVRNVFSPIHINEDEAEIRGGENHIHLNITNHFQQINLNETECYWTLFENQKAIQNGSILLNIPPQESFEMELNCSLPEDINNNNYFLTLDFIANNQQNLYHHVVRLIPNDWQKKLVLQLDDLEKDEGWTVDTSTEETRFEHKQFLFRDATPKAGWFLMTQDGNVRLITDGPFLLFDEDINSSTDSVHHDLWIYKRNVDRAKKNILVESSLNSTNKVIPITLHISTLFSPYGYMDIQYEIFSSSKLIDPNIIGLGFQLPSTLQHIHYVGKGPYSSYPGNRAFNDFGIFSFLKGEKFLSGNREKVTLSALTGTHGYGLGIMMLDGNMSIIPNDDGIIVSINSAMAGLGNKNHNTLYPIDLSQKTFSATFRLIPLHKNKYPSIFADTFDI